MSFYAGLSERGQNSRGLVVEGFPGTARPEGKKVRVVRQLLSAFLAGDVDGDRHSLAVSVIDFHRGVFAVLHTFLVHQAHRRVR